MLHLRHPLLAIGFLFFASVALATSDSTALDHVLGAEGQVFSVVAGPYGEIFPGGTEDEAENSVLALRTQKVDGSSSLAVLPATLGRDRDESPVLVLETTSNRLHLLWQSWSGLAQSQLLVANLSEHGWSDPIEISGQHLDWKSSPSLAVTKDTFRYFEGDEIHSVDRTVVHVLWSQETVRGIDTLYAPLVLLDGQYIGKHPLVVLNELVPPSDGAAGPLYAPVRPSITAGDSANSAIATFYDLDRRELVTVDLSMVQGEVTALADELERGLENGGRTLSGPNGLERMIDESRSQLIDFGARLQVKREFLEAFASVTADYLRSTRPTSSELKSIAAEARSQLIDFGVQLGRGKLTRVSDESRSQLIDFGATQDRKAPQSLRARVVGRFALPEAADAPMMVYSSRSGLNLLVFWEGSGVVEYRETLGSGRWSRPLRLKLGEQLSARDVRTVLQNRIEQRQ